MFPSFSSKEIDALSEAYASVYEAKECECEDEEKKEEGGKHKEAKHPKGKEEKGEKEMKEEIYDLILSHLLSEGFADNATSALAIMANMSEEWRDTILEAQHARENPEKHEEEEKKEHEKKYGHVRGEKTPMPPRGDKRREAFEKWYASQKG